MAVRVRVVVGCFYEMMLGRLFFVYTKNEV
jgi:hypothetical protein